MVSFDDPKPQPEKRKQQIIYLLPSLKDEVEKRRREAGQNLSEWIERAIKAALAKPATEIGKT
jgi:post-segregation antitoxin (ccd killing protein)